MVDVVYSSDDLTVFGGPTSLDVDVSIGAQGIRGSRIYSVTADPRTLTAQELPADLQEYDLAIVTGSGTTDAFTIYQKIGQTPQSWEQLPSIALNVFSARQEVVFNAQGVATVAIPVSAIFDLDAYTVDKFMVQYQLENRNEGETPLPVASSISLSIVPDVQANIQYLVGAIAAVEFNGSAWSPVTSSARMAHAFVTVV